MSGAERSFVTVGFSWTLAKGFLQGERRAEFSRGSGSAGVGRWDDDVVRPRQLWLRG